MIENNTNKIKELVMVDKISNLIWNKIYKKELWQNLRFPIGQCYEDLYIHPQLFLLVKKAAYINKAFYFNNRINENSTTSDNNDFRVHNRYGKFLAYKEHQRIGSSLNWNFVVTWAIDKAINEAIKTFYIDYNSQEKLSDAERKEVRTYLSLYKSGNISVKYRILIWSAIYFPIICRIYSDIRYLHYKIRRNGLLI